MTLNHETMTPKSRILSGIFGGRVDRFPVGSTMSVATHEQMDKLGVGFPEAHYDPEAMAKLASASYEIIGMDTIKVPFSVWNLSSSLGTTMNWGSRNKWPDGVPIFRDPEEVKIPKDFLSRPGTNGVLEAIKILKKKYPDVAIIGTVMGPLTQCFNLVGVENVMLMIATQPDKIKRFLERFIDPVVEYANAQVDAGIDALDYADHATGGLISAETYKEFIMPMHKRIVKEIKTPCVLHICGNTLDRVEHIIESGFPCFNIDTWVDAFHAKRVAKNRISLWGGISNINSLLQGTPEDVKRDAYYAMDAGFEVIGIECSVPVQTPDRNLMAIMEAVKEYPAIRSPQDHIREFAKGLARSFMDEEHDFFKDLVNELATSVK